MSLLCIGQRAGIGVVAIAWFLLLSTAAGAAGSSAQQGNGRVARAMFTTKVTNREPVDQVIIADNALREIFFFSDLRHFEGRTIVHRWEYRGQVVSEKRFEVKGPRWRVYSKKTMEPSQTGRWTAIIVDERGWPLKASVFQYVEKGAAQQSVVLPPDVEAR